MCGYGTFGSYTHAACPFGFACAGRGRPPWVGAVIRLQLSVSFGAGRRWDGWWFTAGVGAGAGVTAQASGCSGRKGLPRSEVSSGPLPADVTELCVSAVLPFFSAGAEKREGCLVLKHNRHCLAGILGGNTPKMTIPPEMTIIFNTAGFLQPRSYPLPPGLTVRCGCPRLMGVSLPLCRRASGCCIVRLWRVTANSRTPVVAARRGSGRLFGRFSVVGFRR